MRRAIFFAICSLGLVQSGANGQEIGPVTLTESQEILAKVMDDIRRCDKTVRYEYDSKTRHLSPPEVNKIKGLKLIRLHRDIAVFKINETYRGLRATMMTVGRPNPVLPWPIHTVAFRESYQTVRLRLEHLWQIQLEDNLRPGPDVISDGLYAEKTMTVDGKERTLSLARMPRDVSPHIPGPEVGCNHGER